MISFFTFYIYRLPLSAVIIGMLIATPVIGFSFALLERRWPRGLLISCRIISVILIGVILYITLFNRSGLIRQPAVLMPFSVFIRAQEQPENYRELLMNILLFWPLGLFLPRALNNRKHPVIRSIVIACILSVPIECVQFFFGLGLAETDDVIANTVGAAIGAVSFIVAEKAKVNLAGERT